MIVHLFVYSAVNHRICWTVARCLCCWHKHQHWGMGDVFPICYLGRISSHVTQPMSVMLKSEQELGSHQLHSHQTETS